MRKKERKRKEKILYRVFHQDKCLSKKEFSSLIIDVIDTVLKHRTISDIRFVIEENVSLIRKISLAFDGISFEDFYSR